MASSHNDCNEDQIYQMISMMLMMIMMMIMMMMMMMMMILVVLLVGDTDDDWFLWFHDSDGVLIRPIAQDPSGVVRVHDMLVEQSLCL